MFHAHVFMSVHVRVLFSLNLHIVREAFALIMLPLDFWLNVTAVIFLGGPGSYLSLRVCIPHIVILYHGNHYIM